MWIKKITGAKSLFFVPHICDQRDEVGQTEQLRLNKGLSLHAHFEFNLPLDCNLTLNFEVFLLEQKKMILRVDESKTAAKLTRRDGLRPNVTGMQTAADYHHLTWLLYVKGNQSKWKYVTAHAVDFK